MIEGLTHENGELNKITKYKGKISTGYGPKEGPNTGNHPVAAGFFRMLKEQTRTERIGAEKKVVTIKEWVTNETAQKALEMSLPTPNATPRRIEIVCLYKTVAEMWESSMAMYSGSEGLLCKSHGKGTNAKYLKFSPSGDREWINRNGEQGCQFKDCPDYKAGKCKPTGLLKCFPIIDMSPNPYRFETRSINTIMGIESAFKDLESLLYAAHAVKQLEAGKTLLYDGFFGAKLYLVHRKIKSGGKDVYITDLMPTPEFTEAVMEPIKRGLSRKNDLAKLAATDATVLEIAGRQLTDSKETPETSVDGAVPLEVSDQQELAVNFGADADEGSIPEVTDIEVFDATKTDGSGPPLSGEDMGKKIAETMMSDGKKLPEKKK